MSGLRSYWLLLLFVDLVLGHEGSPSPSRVPPPVSTICNETSPLSTKYFIPFYESSRSTVGCVSLPEEDKPPVHVIKLNNSLTDPLDIVLLTLSDHGEYPRDKGMVFILLSAHPVNWRISIISEDMRLMQNQHSIILSAGSNIVEKNFKIGQLQQVRESPSRLTSQTIRHYVTRHWGRMTTYTQIGVAHRIRIALPSTNMLPETCNLNSSSPNPGVDAFFIEKKEASGCYRAEMAGTSEFDMYLIYLKSAGNSSHSPTNATVYLSLNPDVTLTDGAALSRDLVLVLKSSQPVRWLLQSKDLIGKLTVISNGDDVENFSLAPSQRLNIIKKKNLPDSLEHLGKDSLLRDVGKSSSLVSYIKVDLANVLTLVIPPRAKRGLASIYSNRDVVLPSDNIRAHFSKDSMGSSIIIPEKEVGRGMNESREHEDLLLFLRHSMSKDCNQKETSVTFPLYLIKRFNISGLTLNDPSCRGVLNATHAVLKSIGTSCGSLNYFSGKHPMLKNNVRVFLNGDSKATLRIPFSCRFKNGFPGFSSLEKEGGEADIPYDYEEEGEEDDYGDEEMYELHVSRVTHRGQSQPLAKNFGQTAVLSPGDVIKVQTSFETRASLNLALERCWLANHSSPDSELLLQEDLWLIWDGCPAHENITALRTAKGQNPAFAFKISKEIAKMTKLYIFCVLGLCSPMETNHGKLKKCMDPSVTCGKEESPHMGPSAQQLSRRGPFYIVGGERDPVALLQLEEHGHSLASEDGAWNSNSMWPSSIRDKKIIINNEELGGGGGGSSAGTEKDPNSELRSSHVIMVGVPTEVAVAISIASFIIGASLTGVLCCLHHKKIVPKESDRRNIHHELRHLNVRAPTDVHDQNGELQSMIQSTPDTVQT